MNKSSNLNISFVYFIGGLECVVLLISPADKSTIYVQNYKTLHTTSYWRKFRKPNGVKIKKESEKYIYYKKLLWFLCFVSMRKASRRNLAFKTFIHLCTILEKTLKILLAQ